MEYCDVVYSNRCKLKLYKGSAFFGLNPLLEKTMNSQANMSLIMRSLHVALLKYHVLLLWRRGMVA